MPGKMMNFELPKGKSSIIKVIGVGGGGSNAVNHMYNEGIKGVDFVVCNTDAQALDNSPVPIKISLGAGLTEGLGAGGNPEVGKNSALENIEQVKEILEKNTQMVFVTAGMGGGTGTGGAPVIAKTAKDLGILTVGIVTIPFSNEGPKRKQQAEEGLDQLRESVDALLIICNDKLREMYGNLGISSAFKQADNVLTTAAKGIAEMISVHGMINVDFKDVNTVMKDSGVAIMGSGIADGEDRAVKAVEQALASPLLNDNKITGARYVLLNITAGTEEPTLDEISEISDYVQLEAGHTANVIMGVGMEESLEEKLSVTLIAAGFDTNPDLGFSGIREPEKVVRQLGSQPVTVRTLDDMPEGETVGDVVENKEQVPESTEPDNPDDVEDVENAEVPEFTLLKKEPEKKQTSFEFELNPSTSNSPAKDQPKSDSTRDAFTESPENKEGTPFYSGGNTPGSSSPISASGNAGGLDDPLKSKDRINRLKELSYKSKTHNGVSDMENEPAYHRKNIELDNVPHSSESEVSRLTLSESDDEEKKIELKPDNPFLHDNVD
jgi:cell division protein FtsZ